jgi:hypothetical protein
MNRKYEINYEGGDEALWKIAVASFRDICQAGIHAMHVLGEGKDIYSMKCRSDQLILGESQIFP